MGTKIVLHSVNLIPIQIMGKNHKSNIIKILNKDLTANLEDKTGPHVHMKKCYHTLNPVTGTVNLIPGKFGYHYYPLNHLMSQKIAYMCMVLTQLLFSCQLLLFQGNFNWGK